jgi:hypothetical protein
MAHAAREGAAAAAASQTPNHSSSNGATHEPLSIAYYCTGHGLGHATRSIEVCKHLVERGHTVTVITGAPARVFLREVRHCVTLLQPAAARAVCAAWCVCLCARPTPPADCRASECVCGARREVAARRKPRLRCSAQHTHPHTPTPTPTPTQVPSARFVLRKAVLDAGAKQLDPFTVDVRGSLELYHATAVVNREAILDAEVQWLAANHMDLVVSDVVPIVCAAAARAGIPAVCVSNFSWGASGHAGGAGVDPAGGAHTARVCCRPSSAAAVASLLPCQTSLQAHTTDPPPLHTHAHAPHTQTSSTPSTSPRCASRSSGSSCGRSRRTMRPPRCCCGCPATCPCPPSPP